MKHNHYATHNQACWLLMRADWLLRSVKITDVQCERKLKISHYPLFPAFLLRFLLAFISHSYTLLQHLPLFPSSLPPFLFLPLSILPSLILCFSLSSPDGEGAVCVCVCVVVVAWLLVSLHIEITCTFCPYPSKQ